MAALIQWRLGAASGLLLLLIASTPALAAGDLTVKPKVVRITSFFSGVRMHFTADIPPDTQAVLRIRGKRIESELMRKAQLWELWLNSGEVDIGNTPGLYIVLSSDPRLLSPSADNYPWGYAALEREARFRGRIKASEDLFVFNEFVRLKEKDELYHLYPGGLTITPIGDGRRQVRAEVPLPSRLKPGLYRVALWIVRNGRTTDRLDASFEVRREGVTKFLNALAMKHGVFYGFLAVALAMVVGMLTGFVFKHRSGGH